MPPLCPSRSPRHRATGCTCISGLRTVRAGPTAFTDAANDYGLSGEAQAFLAGQLAHARAICAVLAPLVNSYKRLMSGQEAPIYVTWAQLNRGALLRVPRLSEPHRIGHAHRDALPDPSCNPYLAFTALLHAGLRGIQDGLPLPPAAEEELYMVSNRHRHLKTLPASLREALDEFEEQRAGPRCAGAAPVRTLPGSQAHRMERLSAGCQPLGTGSLFECLLVGESR